MKKSMFNAKELVVNAIKDQLEKDNIEKLLLNFSLHSDEYSAHLKPLNNEKAIRFKIDESDTSMIKRVFVSKIKRKIENIENYKHLILSIDINKDEFELFLNDNNDNVTKFEI